MVGSSSLASPGKALAESGINWGWLLALGALVTLLGVVGLGMTYRLTIVAVFWFGILAVIGGAAQLVDAFHHTGWKGILWHVAIGLVYVVAGLVMIALPVSSAFWLTLFLAISLVVVGVLRLVMAFQIRGEGPLWVLALFSGIISIVLGVLIYGVVTPPGPEALATAAGQADWVRSWGWVIGLFVAIELIIEGLTLISLALVARRSVAAHAAVSTP
jgi:uncharacterized membrane protein HdeD (DUF308 family)